MIAFAMYIIIYLSIVKIKKFLNELFHVEYISLTSTVPGSNIVTLKEKITYKLILIRRCLLCLYLF